MRGKIKKRSEIKSVTLKLTRNELSILNSLLGSTSDATTPGSGKLWAQFQMLYEHGEVS
jgi:hypothetical protein